MRKQINIMNLIKTVTLAISLMSTSVFAQFSLNNGTLLNSGKNFSASGLDTIFVVAGFNNVVLQYTNSDTTDFSWSRFSIQDGAVTTPSLIPSSIVSNQKITTLSISEPGGYQVEIGPTGSSVTKNIWVIDYEEHTPQVDSVVIYDSSRQGADSCSLIKAEAFVSSDSVITGDPVLNKVVRLTRYQSVNWSSDPALTFDSKEFSINLFAPNIPYQDTRVKASLAESFFDNVLPFNTGVENDTLYIPVAVKLDDINAIIIERNNNNELEKKVTGDVKGSAPLNVDFSTKGATSKVEFYDWEILAMSETDSQKITFALDSFRYEFRNDVNDNEEADYLVRVTVSNDYCSASTDKEVRIVSSYLDAANIMIIGFGASEEAGQFKVVYKSLKPETFRGAIYNRWGRRVFSWTDPELGWDGRYNGKYVSPGVYYYVITATGTDGEKWKIKRDLNVIRSKDGK
ncbi:gliding motility-associated C-terminal domain-containing protein [Saccharicrinis sp. FJH54]|uniref:T9SS type B sorting domain-containing protein n=1 Tax=Saccharicrinis sp. FJH54 TaxID=3344665 RepID=UPI0035D4F0B0